MNIILKDRRYQGEPESKILRAFQVLDTQNNGYLTEDEFRNYLCKEGNQSSNLSLNIYLSVR
jgi:Ca2+-binding EF-hand superfamily protein